MGTRLYAWLIILISVAIMTAACFAPAVRLDNEIVPGWAAAQLSAAGTYLGVAKQDAELAVPCGCGLLANILFVAALGALILRHLFHWERPGHRRLAFYASAATAAALASIYGSHGNSNFVGAWLWLLAHAALSVGLWMMPQPQRGRGFQVIRTAVSVIPLPPNA